MNKLHHGACLTVYSREQIVARIASGQTATEVGEAFAVSVCTGAQVACAAPCGRGRCAFQPHKRARPRCGTPARYDHRSDRSSAPDPADDRGSDCREAGPCPLDDVALAQACGAAWSADADIDPPEPARRDQRERPGHRVTGTRIGCRNRGARLPVAVDDATRLAYIEVLADERRDTTTGFLLRALRWFRDQGIRAEQVMTDNGSA